jgi:NAD(P)-dependent dehydrogenase (short-subunit alcohol dehydrogenase family)
MSFRALVVGGTSGIGNAIASRIASTNSSAHIIISGRKKPEVIPHANMEFRQLDASSMRAIKRYTDSYKSAGEPELDLLVLTQGILTMAGRTETPEGLDNKMALHYYGRQLLIRELTPVLKDDAKVILVLDSLRGSPDKLIWDDLDLKNNFTLGNAAGHCMAMNDGMMQWYAAQQSTTKRYFVHTYPGLVNTNIAAGLPWYLRPAAKGTAALLAKSPESYAESVLEGTEHDAREGQKEGRFWGALDTKGKKIPNRPIWTKEQMEKVKDHTWKILDEAINTKE